MTEGARLLGGIDAGGTTFKCGLASADGSLVATRRVKVTDPDATIAACADFFSAALQERDAHLSALGIGSFGPVDVDPHSPFYGTILETPKPGWSDVGLRARFAEALGVPVTLDTDVNAALAGEIAIGAARGARSAAYVTIGTGIGAGLWDGERFLAKPLHPEFGHIRVERHVDDLAFKGVCRFHGACLEGLASATALGARFGDPAKLLPEHPAWEMEAFYLAQACVSLTLTARPERILLGGGVMLAEGLIPRIRKTYCELMNGYVGMTAELAGELIQRPALGDDAGLLGAITLARQLAR